MHGQPFLRATLLALISVLAFAGTAFADQLLADGDLVTGGVQGTTPLGDVPAGSVISRDVEFTLNCVLLNHVDVGQTVNLTWSGLGSAPLDGAIVSVTPGSVGPITSADGWVADGLGCPSPVPSKVGTLRSRVTLRAPTTAVSNQIFTIVYDRSLSPAGNNDTSAFTRSATQVSFSMNVVAANAAPTLNLPTSHQEQGNTAGGWIADWSAVSATDPEDNPDPTPTCLPAAGTVLLVGSTTAVSCSVTDSAGATTTGTFNITVIDTVDPTLSGMPADQSVTTRDPSGAVVTYTLPTATDIVDRDPTVVCSPASGSTFPAGATSVTCTATDDQGNDASASFTVTVNYVPNTAPTLTLPASHQEEGNTPGGWIADWSGVSATDPEDDPDPAASCLPVAGTVLPVGLTTTVSCSVTDSDGATTSGTFDITVVDTTAPVLSGMPGDRSVTTSDPGGIAVSFGPPTATDVVDRDPYVGCSRASGWRFPVGTTTVTCTATDDSGNSARASFRVTVAYVAPHSASAIWLEPLGGVQVFEANRGRTIPVKVRLFVDGVERSSGQARLTLLPCGGETASTMALTWSAGRWNVSLDTSMLSADCYTVTASIDGLTAGSFRLEAMKVAASAVPGKVGPKKPR